MAQTEPLAVPVDAVMAELQERVRSRLRREVVQHGASDVLEDPAIFADVERVLRAAAAQTSMRALLLPEFLGDPASWRLEPELIYQSHRRPLAATVVRGIKQRVIMPAVRWLFEYSHNNFARQRRVNHVLFACVQELAIQNAELRREFGRLKDL